MQILGFPIREIYWVNLRISSETSRAFILKYDTLKNEKNEERYFRMITLINSEKEKIRLKNSQNILGQNLFVTESLDFNSKEHSVWQDI